VTVRSAFFVAGASIIMLVDILMGVPLAVMGARLCRHWFAESSVILDKDLEWRMDFLDTALR